MSPDTGAVEGSRSSEGSSRRKTREPRSPHRSGGCARPRLEPTTMSNGPAARQSWSRCKESSRWFSPASAREGCGSRAAATGSIPTRRCHQAPAAAGGAMSAPDAQPMPPGAPSARRATQWPNAGAQLRAAGSGEVTRAHTEWPNARTVVAHTSPRLAPAPRRGGSGTGSTGGGRLLHHSRSPHPRRQRVGGDAGGRGDGGATRGRARGEEMEG